MFIIFVNIDFTENGTYLQKTRSLKINKKNNLFHLLGLTFSIDLT